MLKENTKAKNFKLKDKDENVVELNNIDSKYIVLYFYPKDNTSVCTLEAIEFTSKKKDLEKLGATIIGISGGDAKSKTKFCEKNNLTITLLSDTDFKVSTLYGVYGEKKFMGRSYMGISRITFILDKDKKIIKVFEKVKPNEHANEVVEYLKNIEN